MLGPGALLLSGQDPGTQPNLLPGQATACSPLWASVHQGAVPASPRPPEFILVLHPTHLRKHQTLSRGPLPPVPPGPTCSPSKTKDPVDQLLEEGCSTSLPTGKKWP